MYKKLYANFKIKTKRRVHSRQEYKSCRIPLVNFFIFDFSPLFYRLENLHGRCLLLKKQNCYDQHLLGLWHNSASNFLSMTVDRLKLYCGPVVLGLYLVRPLIILTNVIKTTLIKHALHLLAEVSYEWRTGQTFICICVWNINTFLFFLLNSSSNKWSEGQKCSSAIFRCVF